MDEVNEKLKLQAFMVDGCYGDEDEINLGYGASKVVGGFYLLVMKGSLNNLCSSYSYCFLSADSPTNLSWLKMNYSNWLVSPHSESNMTNLKIRRASVLLAQGVLDPEHTTCYSLHRYIAT